MTSFFCLHQLARFMAWDHRKLRSRLAELGIKPAGVLTNGRGIYPETVIDQLEKSEAEKTKAHENK
jgi:hypothetical protein